MVQLRIGQESRCNKRWWLLLPLALACSGEVGVDESDSVDVGDAIETEPLLVDDSEADPPMFFGESEEEQERARAALEAAFSDGGLIEKTVNTSACLQFTVPPFIGAGGVQNFFNTLPVGGLTPTDACGTGTGAARRVLVQNFSTLSRAGAGSISVGVRNASVAECADLTVSMALAEQRSGNQGTRILQVGGDNRARVQQRNGVSGCASFFAGFGASDPLGFEGKDLWIAVQAKKNGQVINDRVLLIRSSDL